MHGVLPANKTDFAAMLHDIQYMQYAGASEKDIEHADNLAMGNSDNSTAGIATKIGLSTRKVLGIRFDKPLDGVTVETTQLIGNKLMNYVKDNYSQLFNQYNINPQLY